MTSECKGESEGEVQDIRGREFRICKMPTQRCQITAEGSVQHGQTGNTESEIARTGKCSQKCQTLQKLADDQRHQQQEKENKRQS